MIFTPRITAIVAAIVFVSVLLQISFFSLTPIAGTVINIVPVVVIAIGLLGGAVPGAVAGFSAGLLLDFALGGTLGVASLALLAAGYLAGRWREGYDIVSVFVPPAVTAALVLVYGVVLAGLELMLGVDNPVDPFFWGEILTQALLGGLVALALFPLVRRILRPALVDDRRPARRPGARGMLGASR
jgi:rod shape-determining protein MreD